MRGYPGRVEARQTCRPACDLPVSGKRRELTIDDHELDPEPDLEDEAGDPTRHYRATIVGGRVFINDWTPTLAQGGPVGNHFRERGAAGVAIADVTLTRTAGGELESIVRFLTRGDRAGAEEALVTWARVAGHQRIWLEDRVVETGAELPEAGVLGVTCATCAARWEEHNLEFHTYVRSQGVFPTVCPLCGGVLPQWSLAARTSDDAGHDGAGTRSPADLQMAAHRRS